MQDLKDVVSRKETPVLLAKKVQRHSQEADGDLHRGHGHKYVLDAADDQPVVAAVGKAEGEDVLKDHHAGEGFDGDVACKVHC